MYIINLILDDFKIASKKCEIARENDNLLSNSEPTKCSAPLINDMGTLGKGCRDKKQKLSRDFQYGSSSSEEGEAKEFSKKGGDNIKEFTRVILREVICDKIAALYSFEGFKKKKIFKNLNLYELIIKSVRLNKLTVNATEKEISTVIKNWLPQASFRGKNKPNISEEINENEIIV
ncbi:hypothetical protein FQR65_LT17413 [Abscondita terminalis]|nr:hypothetical protein FQR65_LT17413 [Abscondita terminalis]